MSDLVLFIIGSGVFFLGGLGLVLYTLDTFQSWSLRENQDGEDNYLEDEQVHDVVKHPTRRQH